MNKIIPIIPKKSCGECKACCDGTLIGSAHGFPFWKGRPCHFMNDKGCSIYEDRPEDPCKKFECGYLKFDWVPQWMRPDLSGVIICDKTTKTDISYIEVVEYKEKMSARVLSFLFMAYLNKDFDNILYQIEGGWNKIGVAGFLEDENS